MIKITKAVTKVITYEPQIIHACNECPYIRGDYKVPFPQFLWKYKNGHYCDAHTYSDGTHPKLNENFSIPEWCLLDEYEDKSKEEVLGN